MFFFLLMLRCRNIIGACDLPGWLPFNVVRNDLDYTRPGEVVRYRDESSGDSSPLRAL